MNVKYYLKQQKVEEGEKAKDTIVLMSVHIRNQRVWMSTGITINPNDWDKAKQRPRALRGRSEMAEINYRLDYLARKAQEVYYEMLNRQNRISPVRFKQKMQKEFKTSHDREKNTFYIYAEKYKDRLKEEKRSWKSINSTITRLKEFNTQLDFDDFDLVFYKNFRSFLTRKGYSLNYIGKILSNVKRLLNESLEEGIHTNIAWKSKKFSGMAEPVHNIYLTEEELIKIHCKDYTSSPYLDNAADAFLISCYTGLRFSDLKGLKEINISDEGFVIKDMQKVSGRVVVPMHWVVKEILDKRDGKLPRFISNQKMNDYLKEIGRKAEIDGEVFRTRTEGGKKVTTAYRKWQLMTTHTARRSMATNMYNAGIPIGTVSRLLGHHSIKQTIEYLKITETDIAKSLKNHPFFNKSKL